MKKLYDKITKNFRWVEFTKSQTAKRKGISNVPQKDSTWESIRKLTQNVLQPLREEKGGIQITSGFRSIDLNVAIGGSPTSNHCRGEAADIEPLDVDVTLMELLEWIYYNCEFRELIAEYFPDGWVHVAYRENGNIKKLKLKDGNHHYEEVSLEYIKDLYEG